MSEIFKLQHPFKSDRTITHSFLQAGHCLNMYQAELARVLRLKCNDIGKINSAQYILKPNTIAYQEAILFIMMYQALYKKYNGHAISMYRWLHRTNKTLGNSPHLMIVDSYKIAQIVDYLSTQHQ